MSSLSDGESDRLVNVVVERLRAFLRPIVRQNIVDALSVPQPPEELADMARGLAAMSLAVESAASASEENRDQALEAALGKYEQKLMSREAVDVDRETEIIRSMSAPQSEEWIDKYTDAEYARIASDVVVFWFWALCNAAHGEALSLSALDADGLPTGDWIRKSSPPDLDVRSAIKSFLASMDSDERPIPAELATLLMQEKGLTIVP